MRPTIPPAGTDILRALQRRDTIRLLFAKLSRLSCKPDSPDSARRYQVWLELLFESQERRSQIQDIEGLIGSHCRPVGDLDEPYHPADAHAESKPLKISGR